MSSFFYNIIYIIVDFISCERNNTVFCLKHRSVGNFLFALSLTIASPECTTFSKNSRVFAKIYVFLFSKFMILSEIFFVPFDNTTMEVVNITIFLNVTILIYNIVIMFFCFGVFICGFSNFINIVQSSHVFQHLTKHITLGCTFVLNRCRSKLCCIQILICIGVEF